MATVADNRLEWIEARKQARRLVPELDRQTLVHAARGGFTTLRARHEWFALSTAAARELERRYPCRDCGARAGRPCKPEYGCRPEERSPVRELEPGDAERYTPGPGEPAIVKAWTCIAAELAGEPDPDAIGKRTVELEKAFAWLADAEAWTAGLAADGFEVSVAAMATPRYHGATDAPSNCWIARATIAVRS